jgi:hypothetical protein
VALASQTNRTYPPRTGANAFFGKGRHHASRSTQHASVLPRENCHGRPHGLVASSLPSTPSAALPSSRATRFTGLPDRCAVAGAFHVRIRRRCRGPGRLACRVTPLAALIRFGRCHRSPSLLASSPPACFATFWQLSSISLPSAIPYILPCFSCSQRYQLSARVLIRATCLLRGAGGRPGEALLPLELRA